jgi:hypothetical protein
VLVTKRGTAGEDVVVTILRAGVPERDDEAAMRYEAAPATERKVRIVLDLEYAVLGRSDDEFLEYVRVRLPGTLKALGMHVGVKCLGVEPVKMSARLDT